MKVSMIKCPNCRQETRKDLDKCQYCNAALPKGAINKFRDIFLKLFIRPEVLERLRDDKNLQKYSDTKKEITGNFNMTVKDVFSITGRGTVAVGKVEGGTIRVGDTVTWTTKNGKTTSSRITGIEMFRKMIQEASVGNNIGLLLSNINKNDIERGVVITK